MMRLLQNWGRKNALGVKYVSAGYIRTLVADCEGSYDKKVCLDIGNPSTDEHYTTLDIVPGGDIQGDVRCAFAPGHQEKDCPGVQHLAKGWYMLVRMKHTIEHIEWIYQDFLIRWVHSLLAEGGMFYIHTPSLEYNAKVYLENRKLQDRGKQVKYPVHEHIYCSKDVPTDLQLWVNFKFFSGCSPGDYHHAMFDAPLMNYMLGKYFHKVNIAASDMISAVAFKAKGPIVTVDDAVERAMVDV